jgi:hypothetical protein
MVKAAAMKKRYILFALKGELDSQRLKGALTKEALRFFGELGLSEAAIKILAFDIKSKTVGDSMFAMKYEMQIKKLLKETNVDEIVNCLIDMAKGGLKLKDEKQLGAKDQDIARILLDNLTKYEQMK